MPYLTNNLFHNIVANNRLISAILVIGMISACTPAKNASIPPTANISSQTGYQTTPSQMSKTIFFPQQEPVDGERETMTSEISGTLVLVDGCIRVYDAETETSWLLIWPPTFSLNAENNSIQILDGQDNVVARVGDSVRIDGGEIWSPSYFSETMQPNLPADCPSPYWIVGDEVNAIKSPE